MKDIFCKIIDGEIPGSKIYEDDDILVILDISQLTKGHSLVIPKAHYESVLDCDEEIVAKVYKVAQKVAKALVKAYNCAGVNILTNAKEAAGQSVPHFHVHVLPRYDENDGVKIICEEKEPDFGELAKRADYLKGFIDA